MSSVATQEFGKWRSRLWPIHQFELKKVLPMFSMFFLISFVYTILRDTKDALVVSSIGAEAIVWLKVYGTVPVALGFMILYTKLSNTLSTQRLFYVTLAPFIVFFGLFALVLYPQQEMLQLNVIADFLGGILPAGASDLVQCIRLWPLSAFYVMSELWGSVVLSLLFWGFANQTSRTMEAKRFYTVFGLGANLALIFSGAVIKSVAQIPAAAVGNKALEEAAFAESLGGLMGIVVVFGIIVAGIYYHINKNVLTDPKFYDPTEPKKKKKSKPKMSVGESFKYLLSSRYIGLIALLVICYGVAINLVEVSWKNQLKLAYPAKSDYLNFMGTFSQVTGAVTMFMLLFVGGNAVRKGWRFAALITPIVLLVTGGIFFSVIIWGENMQQAFPALFMGMDLLWITVMVGMAQNIFSKSAKYSLFDPTKEMAYIPLDPEAKNKGKAAVDVVGARLGKSGGAFIQQALFVGVGGLAVVAPIVAGLVAVIVVVWIVTAFALNKQYLTAMGEIEEQAASEAPAVSAKSAGAAA
jgi:AAA family ATP:ADP antiporter